MVVFRVPESLETMKKRFLVQGYRVTSPLIPAFPFQIKR